LRNLSITSSVAYTVPAAAGIVNGAGHTTPITASPIAIFGINGTGGYFGGVNQYTNLHPVTRVNIILEGTNTLTCTLSHYAGFQVDMGAQIHINAINPVDNTSGTLVAESTAMSGTLANGGAGIGAISNNALPANANAAQSDTLSVGTCSNKRSLAGGNIIIGSGTVTGRGGHAAGIGGGWYSYYDGAIIVYGGIVTAIAGYHGAGIGSGCPNGSGVQVNCFSPNGASIALPPAQITAQGAPNSTANMLAGTAMITYINDPNAPLITVRTEDNAPNADIYLDLTQTTGLVALFNRLGLTYDLARVKVGTTNASGILQFRARLDQNTTFYTDASSPFPATLGRPYESVITTVSAAKTVILPLLKVNVSFIDYPSTPLEVGYTPAQAFTNAYRLKIIYNDPIPMTGVTFGLQKGLATDFGPLRFFAADSITEIAAPTTLSNGGVYFVVVPIKNAKPQDVYTDVLQFTGSWNGVALSGYIRRLVDQRVRYNDTQTNTYIKVKATPTTFVTNATSPASVNMELLITHYGLATLYDPAHVVAKYIISTDPHYSAVDSVPLTSWSNLNIPATDSVWTATSVSFAGKSPGKYYIHWYVDSWVVYAHSQDAPATNGGFGPYILAGLVRDVATVQIYQATTIDALANDGLTALSPTYNILSSVTVQPRNGTLASVGTAENSKFIYTSTGADALQHNVDSFRYDMSIATTNPVGTVNAYAWVYVFVLDENDGAATCANTPNYTLTLAQKPGMAAYNYSWYDDAMTWLNDGVSHTMASSGTLDVTFYVKPRPTSPYATLNFPPGELRMHVANPAGTMAKLRWTGAISNDWKNPHNWVEVRGAAESPSTHPPTKCSDVVIPTSVNNFPELTTTVYCHDILLHDRAMLINPHVLDYAAAAVDFKLKPSELDRFVMWSAPLLSMYSGDYHYRNASNGMPQWGDAFMQLFQQANPDGGSALANYFTTTFIALNQPLELGRAFNLRVAGNRNTREESMRFPRADLTYQPEIGSPVSLSRTNSDRFITDNVTPDASGAYNLPVFGGGAGNALVQVVNPYMAWLRMDSFLKPANNPALQSGYYLWNGEVANDLSSFAIVSGNRLVVGSGGAYAAPASALYVPPLQSFFVEKSNSGAALANVRMSPRWTTSKPIEDYALRASIASGGVLHITAAQGESRASAALVYSPEASNFVGRNDMAAVVYNDQPISVYSFAAQLQALTINVSSTFDMTPVAIGLRIRQAGEIKLSFAGLESFGYSVTLTDKTLNREVDLQKTPEYTFTPIASGKFPLEINNRFVLRMGFTGRGIAFTPTEIPPDPIIISEGNRSIDIFATASPIRSLQVFNLQGNSVYARRNLNESRLNIPHLAPQTYIVKVEIDEETVVRKIHIK
jgi:hypothetical protein